MKLKSMLISLLLAGLLLAACSPAAATADANALGGTSWELRSLDGNDQVGAAIGRQPVTLSFDSETEVSGSGGCNGFGGSYTADASGRISFSELASTLMACQAAGVGEVEGSYFEALNAADHYEITLCEACANPEALTITGGGHTLVFARA